jgi:intracellular sulfur oxidation DsrE/DsrF family protein
MNDDKDKGKVSATRRGLLTILAGLAGAWGLGAAARPVQAAEDASSLRFPDDPAEHKVVYQLNKADQDYQDHILFSVGAMLRAFPDNIHIVVVAIGPGIHLLAKSPGRPVSPHNRERVSSMVHYGVEFHACGNTLKSLGWSADDLEPFAKVVEVGAADLMLLQEQGYAYISW